MTRARDIAWNALHRHAAAAMDLLWPPSCPRCGERAGCAREQFCAACWGRLRPLDARDRVWPLSGTEGGVLVRAAFAVDPLLIDVLTTAKYRGARPVGRRLAARAADLLTLPAGVLVPVPLTRTKRRERGFNQSEDFAAALAATTGRSLRTDLLVRTRGGRALAGLEKAQRRRAVRGAFSVPERAGSPGGPVIVVDDVVTTGSTAAECVGALHRAGVRQVHVAAIARAFQPGDDARPATRDVVDQL